MAATIKNGLGNIVIDNEVIASIASCAALSSEGIAGMAKKRRKDKSVILLKEENASEGVSVYTDDSGITLDMHLITEYGTNIPNAAEKASAAIKEALESKTSLAVKKINIYVEGIKTDK